MPAQPPQPLSDSERRRSFHLTRSSTSSDAPYPVELVKLSGQNSMQGYNVVSLIVYPLQYSPKNRTAKFHRKLALKSRDGASRPGCLPGWKAKPEKTGGD